MLVLHRSFAFPSADAGYAVTDYAQPAFRVRIIESRGVVADEHFLYPRMPWTGYGDRPRLDLVLGGRLRCTENGVERTLGPGEFVIGRALDNLYTCSSGDFFYVGIEWRLGSLGTAVPAIGLPCGKLDSVTLRRAVDNAQALHHAARANAPEPSSHRLAALIADLRAVGAPFDRWQPGDLVRPAATRLQRAAAAVGTALSQLHIRPALTDLESSLGLSGRRVTSLVAEVATTYGLNGCDWRSMRDRWRLMMSMLAMTCPGSRTEDVARAVGYGSPNAFCHALRLAGFPSPGAIRAAMRAP